MIKRLRQFFGKEDSKEEPPDSEVEHVSGELPIYEYTFTYHSGKTETVTATGMSKLENTLRLYMETSKPGKRNLQRIPGRRIPINYLAEPPEREQVGLWKGEWDVKKTYYTEEWAGRERLKTDIEIMNETIERVPIEDCTDE